MDFLLGQANAHVIGRVTDNTGAPVANAGFNVSNHQGMDYNVSTDADGNFNVGVSGGVWYLQLNADDAHQRQLVSPQLQVTLAEGETRDNIVVIVQHATAQITGSVRNNTGTPIACLGVGCSLTLDGTNYTDYVQTDASGNYQLMAFDGTWQVWLNGNANDGLPLLGYECVDGQSVSVPPAAAVVNFTVYPLGVPVMSQPACLTCTQFGFTLHGSPGTSYSVLATTNIALPLADWFTVSSITLSGNSAIIWDDQATNQQRFYRVVTQAAPPGSLAMVTPYVNESDMASMNEAYSTSANAPWGFAHNGLDFMPTGELKAFQAVAAGVVESVELWQNGLNWQVNVRIRHDATFSSEYGFEPMSSLQQDGLIQQANILVTVGQHVSAGDVIGNLHRVNDSSHVHFGLQQNNQDVCPEPYFTDTAKQSILRVLQSTWSGASMCY